MFGGLAQSVSGEGSAPGRWLGAVTVGGLLLVLAIATLATPAHAQEITTPDKLANGTVAYVLAVACCGLAAVAIYLFRELRNETAARMADLVRSYESAMRLQEAGVKLSIQALEAVEVVERVVERFPRSPA